MKGKGRCPVTGASARTAAAGTSNKDWWPEQLNLKILHQNSSLLNPMDKDFNYAEEFKNLIIRLLKKIFIL